MPSLGSLIISARSKIPDIVSLQKAGPPGIPGNFFQIILPNGGLVSATYYLRMSIVFPWGETLASQEFVVNAQSAIQLLQCPTYPGQVGFNVYYGTAAGQETSVQFLPWVFNSLIPFASVILDGSTSAVGSPPLISTAYLPDSDGNIFSAGILFEWASDALNKLSHAVGGVLDYCGVTTQAGNGLYVVPGQWLSITDVWYGGYWIKGGTRAEFFRRNTVTSNVLQMATISITSDRQVIEITYQPDRNSGITVTTADLMPTSTSIGIANTGAFLLPFAFAQIGTEIVAYSSLQGNTMGGLIRGIGNTQAQFWASGTVVQELSLFWNGRRVFNTAYYPGQSNVQLQIPVGWIPILKDYILAQAKKAEQDLQGWKQLEESAFQQAEKWMYSNKGIPTRVQVGGNNNPVVYDQTVAGGILIP
jgi:hypothetical protein